VRWRSVDDYVKEFFTSLKRCRQERGKSTNTKRSVEAGLPEEGVRNQPIIFIHQTIQSVLDGLDEIVIIEPNRNAIMEIAHGQPYRFRNRPAAARPPLSGRPTDEALPRVKPPTVACLG
jgi:hypothetical protein